MIAVSQAHNTALERYRCCMVAGVGVQGDRGRRRQVEMVVEMGARHCMVEEGGRNFKGDRV